VVAPKWRFNWMCRNATVGETALSVGNGDWLDGQASSARTNFVPKAELHFGEMPARYRS
jgi:hypothetical protein